MKGSNISGAGFLGGIFRGAILLWAMILLLSGVVYYASEAEPSSTNNSHVISEACSNAINPVSCVSSLSNAPWALSSDLPDLSVIALDLAGKEAKHAFRVVARQKKKKWRVGALEDCTELLKQTRYSIRASKSELKKSRFDASVALAWLTSIENNQHACLAGLKDGNAAAALVSRVKDNLDPVTVLIGDAKAVVATLAQHS